MKYILFWEYKKKDEAEIIDRFKKRPEAEIQRLFPPYALGGQTKGFSLVEADDYREIEKFYHHYTPLLKTKIFPIIELTELIKIRKY
jgi:hypothetical protein